MVDIRYWQRFSDFNNLKYNEKRLLYILDIIGSAFGSNPLKLRSDDNLKVFDWYSAVWPYIFGDSQLDAALEELVCENLLPKTIRKIDLSTIGDIVIRSIESECCDE